MVIGVLSEQPFPMGIRSGAIGYRDVAEYNRKYDRLMVPLAVDVGLGNRAASAKSLPKTP